MQTGVPKCVNPSTMVFLNDNCVCLPSYISILSEQFTINCYTKVK